MVPKHQPDMPCFLATYRGMSRSQTIFGRTGDPINSTATNQRPGDRKRLQ